MIRYTLSRIGCLILLVGSLLLVLGIAAERSGEPALTLLFGGIVLLFVGFLLWKKFRPEKKNSTRFSLFRKRNRKEDRDRDDEDGWGNRYYD